MRYSPNRLLAAAVLATAVAATCDARAASPAVCAAHSAYRVTIALVGMDPFSIQVPVGARVTFVNKDRNFPHQMTSECKEVDAAGRLEPGQSADTEPFTKPGTCEYCDSLNPENPLRRGKIIVRK
jgi:plastocyanin